MKKFFLSLILGLIILGTNDLSFAKTSVNNSIRGDYYATGVDCFKKGFYDKAEVSFKYAIKINPKNVNARYYLAQTYLMQKRITEAKDQYKRIILLAPQSDAAILSEKGLHLIRQSELGVTIASTTSYNNNLAIYIDNYLDYVMTGDGKILKWESFPITVYVESKKQKDASLKAFEQWQAKSKGLIGFKFVATPNAQIEVRFKDKLETSTDNKNYIAGYSKPYYQGNKIVKSEIQILAVSQETGKDLDDNFITFATLHEIGHSLGFRGHSPDKNDIMAGTSAEPKTNLTQRDINTLNVFYKMDEKTLLARNKGQTDVQLQQAIDYVKQTPDKAVGWANLGDIYRGKKMYSDAVKNYKKAVSLEPEKAELYNLLGSAYLDMGDKQNGFVNLKKACDLDKSNTFYLIQFAKLCLSTGQKEVGKSYINKFLQANPQSQNDENIQKLLELYKN
ncbi:MAG: tetratricopeptide repeat protein [Candidatus Gastranaerophilales bacterium]|nr:tetratricopeptide repeat protein [Candidatus Gastranaerophilales bacterium]